MATLLSCATRGVQGVSPWVLRLRLSYRAKLEKDIQFKEIVEIVCWAWFMRTLAIVRVWAKRVWSSCVRSCMEHGCLFFMGLCLLEREVLCVCAFVRWSICGQLCALL